MRNGYKMDDRIIVADEGYVFRRIHDGHIMGEMIHLGYDHSAGEPRYDLPEYYEQVEKEDGIES